MLHRRDQSRRREGGDKALAKNSRSHDHGPNLARFVGESRINSRLRDDRTEPWHARVGVVNVRNAEGWFSSCSPWRTSFALRMRLVSTCCAAANPRRLVQYRRIPFPWTSSSHPSRQPRSRRRSTFARGCQVRESGSAHVPAHRGWSQILVEASMNRRDPRSRGSGGHRTDGDPAGRTGSCQKSPGAGRLNFAG